MEMFQSSPAHRSGCNPVDLPGAAVQGGCFNPHPPTGAGATLVKPVNATTARLFQSSPAHRSGCNQVELFFYDAISGGFNPHPPTGAGATGLGQRHRHHGHRCFNPHPPTGAGATTHQEYSSSARSRFNPHPPTGAGATSMAIR